MTLGELLERDNNSFGVLRLAAASAVIIDHSFELVTGSAANAPLAGLTALSLGQHAVNVFFVLSGILVAASLDRSRTLIHYLVARALRILPGLICCVLVTVFVVGPLFTSFGLAAYLLHPDTYLYIARTVTLATGNAPLPGVFADNPVAGQINIPLWTIKYEVVCYLLLGLLPFVGLWRSDAGRLLAAAGMVIVYAVAMAIPDLVVPWSSLHWFLNLSLAFALGTAAYSLRNDMIISGWGVLALAALFLLALGSPFERPMTPVFAGYAALWISQFGYGPLRKWTNKIDLSFGVYVYGWVIQQCVVASFPGLDVMGVTIVVFAIILPVAWLSWTVVEKPALGSRKHIEAWLDDQMYDDGKVPARG